MIQKCIEEYYPIGCDAAQSGREQNVSQEGAVSIFGVEDMPAKNHASGLSSAGYLEYSSIQKFEAVLYSETSLNSRLREVTSQKCYFSLSPLL
jgi:hypothetical protein